MSCHHKRFKKERVYTEECVTDDNEIDVSTVALKNNKIINMLSTVAGQKPEIDAWRWDKQNKRYVNIKRPNVFGQQNRRVGDVDLIHSIYKIRLRNKRRHIPTPVLSLGGLHNSQCMATF